MHIALWRELVDRAVVAGAAVDGCTVKISLGVADHSVISEARLRGARKAISHALGPLAGRAAGHFENDPATARGCAPVACSPVQISGRIRNQAADGAGSVGASLETIENALGPGRAAAREFVDRAHVVHTGIISGSVQIARLVGNYAAVG